MIIKTPTKYFLVSGSSEGFSLLNAFDGALLASGVGDTNLVRMSSILPPKCKEISPIKLPQGNLIPIAYASLMSDKPGEIISSAVAVGIPEDPSLAGLIMEYSTFADRNTVEKQVTLMVLKGMAFRKRSIKAIKCVSSTMKIETIGATFAGVVLWD